MTSLQIYVLSLIQIIYIHSRYFWNKSLYTCTYIYTYVCPYVHKHTHIQTHTQTHTHTYTHTYTQTHLSLVCRRPGTAGHLPDQDGNRCCCGLGRLPSRVGTCPLVRKHRGAETAPCVGRGQPATFRTRGQVPTRLGRRPKPQQQRSPSWSGTRRT